MTMLCHEIERRLADWTAGRLSGPQIAELQNHLLTCHACRARSSAFTSTLHALSTVFSDEKPGPYFTAKVLARAEQATAPQRSWRWVPAAGTALVLLIAALSWIRSWSGPEWRAVDVVAEYEQEVDGLLENLDADAWDLAGIWTLPDDEDWEEI